LYTLVSQERQRIDIAGLRTLEEVLKRMGKPLPLVTTPLVKPEPAPPRPTVTQTPYGEGARQNKIGGLVASKENITIAAKKLRDDLARTFPGSKFCVTVERYSMGESIRVSWINGPSSVAVDKVLNKYQDIDYDPYSQEILSGGNRFVQGQRKYTKAVYDKENTEFTPGGTMYPTAWNKLSTSDYFPQPAFSCVRGIATSPEATY